ncbi:unnamed protein product [Albugo candida]|uniref:Uncharacterized protein n=1 Tax=Albugo candida TaxID=65357 RepID=A0A024FYU3_9STRA|nr:unnamed protein product [Albugo candida]|eukprot:CCI39587.1 unnamed protein product [Albugo candida]
MTASICIPVILLSSPIVITLCFLTSPIWMAALLVVGMQSIFIHTKKKMIVSNYSKSSSPVANAVSPHSVTRNGSKLAVGHSLQKLNGHGNGHGISVL